MWTNLQNGETCSRRNTSTGEFDTRVKDPAVVVKKEQYLWAQLHEETGIRKNACNALKRLNSQSIDGCWALHVLKKKVEVGTLESDWELIKRILKQVNEKGWIKKESSHAMYILCTGKFRILQICQIGH